MKVKGCRAPGYGGRSAMARNPQKPPTEAELRSELLKIPGVRVEMRDGVEVLVGLETLTAASIPANVHPAVRRVLLGRIAKDRAV